jgi:hypothetical protein
LSFFKYFHEAAADLSQSEKPPSNTTEAVAYSACSIGKHLSADGAFLWRFLSSFHQNDLWKKAGSRFSQKGDRSAFSFQGSFGILGYPRKSEKGPFNNSNRWNFLRRKGQVT